MEATYENWIANSFGEILSQETGNSNEHHLNVSQLAPDAYRMIVVKDDQVVQKLFVRQ